LFSKVAKASRFSGGVQSRTVPETTVSSKMIIGLRGILTIEL
jgi:hypothetical protein